MARLLVVGKGLLGGEKKNEIEAETVSYSFVPR